jgi:hypothetical protein
MGGLARGILGVAAAALIALLLLAPAGADTVTGDNVRIDFHGQIFPKVLPRSAPTAVSLHVSGKVHPLGSDSPAALKRLSIQINRHAVFTTHGLPSCPPRRLRATSTKVAIAKCGDALIGSGYFTSHIEIPDQAPFPTWGRALAFNTRKGGRQAVVIHVFGRNPAPISTVLSAALRRSGPASGPFGRELSIEVPKIGDEWGYVSGFALTFHRLYRYRGQEKSVVRASCPAPPGLHVVPFTAARGVFELADGKVLARTLNGSCRAG